MPARRRVWLAWQHYAPDSIPRHPKVEHVFATEEAANAWRNETLAVERSWGSYRRIECREVERATSPRKEP